MEFQSSKRFHRGLMLAFSLLLAFPLIADNKLNWSRTVTPAGAQTFNATTDASGNLYVVGLISEQGRFDFGDGFKVEVEKEGTGVLAKYSSTGKVLWVRSGPAGSWYWGVAVSPKGLVSVAASLRGDALLNLSKTVSLRGMPRSETQALIVYDSQGEPQWARTVEAGSGSGLATAFGPDGSVYFAGEHWGSTQFGSGVKAAIQKSPGYDSKGLRILFLTKYDSHGTPLWSRTVRALDSVVDASRIDALSVDQEGNLWASGSVYGDARLSLEQGGPEFQGKRPYFSFDVNQNQTPFLAKFDPDGHNFWIRQRDDAEPVPGKPIGLQKRASFPDLAPGVTLYGLRDNLPIYSFDALPGPKGSVLGYGMAYAKGRLTLGPGLSLVSPGDYNWQVFQFQPSQAGLKPAALPTALPRKDLIEVTVRGAGHLWVDGVDYDTLRDDSHRLLELTANQAHQLEMRYLDGSNEVLKLGPAKPGRRKAGFVQPSLRTTTPRWEFESLKVVASKGAPSWPQDMPAPAGQEGWSTGRQLLVNSRKGGTVTFEFPVVGNGPWQPSLVVTGGPDCGIVEISLDGEVVAPRLDFYAAAAAPLGPINLGIHDLEPGPHRLEFTVIGQSMFSTNAVMGLDYLQLLPVRTESAPAEQAVTSEVGETPTTATSGPTGNPVVYAGGGWMNLNGVSEVGYWRNGFWHRVESNPPNRIGSEVWGIAVDKGDVYLAGDRSANDYDPKDQLKSIQRVPGYWKNSQWFPAELGDNWGGDPMDICVVGGDVYLAGRVYDKNRTSLRLGYWKNGAWTQLAGGLPPLGIGGSFSVLLVTEGDVYMLGNRFEKNQYISGYWKNGVWTIPKASSAGETFEWGGGIAKVGQDLVVMGSRNGKPGYLIGDRWESLAIPAENQGYEARRLYAFGPDVYVLGYHRTPLNQWVSGYWKNGRWTEVTQPSSAASTSLAVFGNEVYLNSFTESEVKKGVFGSGTGYWKGKEPTQFPFGGLAKRKTLAASSNSIAVVDEPLSPAPLPGPAGNDVIEVTVKALRAGQLFVDGQNRGPVSDPANLIFELPLQVAHTLELRYAEGDNETHSLPPSNPRRWIAVFDQDPPAAAPTTTALPRIEIETLKVLAAQGLTYGPQDMRGFSRQLGEWSQDRQLFVGASRTGNLVLELPVTEAGTWNLSLVATVAPDFGIVQVTLDGTPLARPLDLYSRSVAVAGPFDLGRLQISAGVHRLEFTVTGKNAASSNTLFGLDYLQWVP